MNESTPEPPLDRTTAEDYASWFKALADATRIQIVSLLARRGAPMTVGEIVAAVHVGQSTVSAHLKVLSEVRFVLVERRGTASLYRVNKACVACFPTAADVVMGHPVPSAPSSMACGLPGALPTGIEQDDSDDPAGRDEEEDDDGGERVQQDQEVRP